VRLLRPHVPLEVRCRVAARQLGLYGPNSIDIKGKAAELLARMLEMLAQEMGCEVCHLHLDHDPALGARQKLVKGGVHVGYVPDANDPAFLIYREKHAHHIKTNVRGEGAQHPDRVLIKKERRREGRSTKKRSSSWPRRKLQGQSIWPKGRKIQNRRKPL
jgi:hypothetical protein